MPFERRSTASALAAGAPALAFRVATIPDCDAAIRLRGSAPGICDVKIRSSGAPPADCGAAISN
jgi:hypothetical protein